MNKDLTEGKPERVLWAFCLPLFGSVIFQQLYNIADSLVAGKFLGENALAAVGNSYEITLLFIAFSFGCNIGCSVIVSQVFGAREYGKVKTTVSTAMIASVVVCVVLMLFGFVCGNELLELIHTPKDIFADSKVYLNIYILGFPFLLFYNVATGIFSALGDSKTPFYFLAVSSVVNIMVDIIFVAIFEMGVAGVAWATLLCQGISCLLAMFFVFRRLKGMIPKELIGNETTVLEEIPLFSWDLFRRIVAIAVPSIFQQGFISIGNIIIQGVINGFGPGVIAGYAAAIKLNNLVITSFTTLGNGISNFTAQNVGAGLLERVPQGFRAGVKLVWALCLPFVIIYLLCAKGLVGFFMNEPSTLALGTGVEILKVIVPFYFVIAVKLVADGVLRGNGMMKVFMISTCTDLILRVVLAIFLSKGYGTMGIWCAWPIGWSIATVMSVLFYRSGPWKKVKSNRLAE